MNAWNSRPSHLVQACLCQRGRRSARRKRSRFHSDGDTRKTEGKSGQLDAHAQLSEHVAARIEVAVLRPGLTGAVLTDETDAGEERLRYLAEATAIPRETERQFLLELRDRGSLRNVDVDALRVVLGIGLACVSSAKPAIQHLIGLDLDDESQRKRLVEGITDLLLNGLLPR